MKKPDSTWENYTAALGHRADGRLGTEQVNGGTTATSSYDNAGQLTAQSGTAPVSYSYGTRGNRLTSTASSATTTYTTNPNGSVATATSGSTVTTYTYDDAGRRTQAETKVSGTTTRTVATSYDARGKPATITDTAGSATITESRTYDGNSQLTANAITGGDSPGSYQMMWDTTVAVPRLSETRKNGTTWVRSDYGNELLSFKTGAYPKWYKLDARNSIINPDNNTNNATGPTAYDPYGIPTGASYYTTGYRSERHLGNLIHLRNRDYDPTTGQFTTQDELDGIGGTPTVANMYHYADNDPDSNVDPLGLRPGNCVFGRYALCDRTASVAWEYYKKQEKHLEQIRTKPLCRRYCPDFLSKAANMDDVAFYLRDESRTGHLLDAKPAMGRYQKRHPEDSVISERAGPYFDHNLADIGDPDYLIYYDTIGNIMWARLINIYLELLPDNLVVRLQETMKDAGSTEPGDNILVRAGLKLGKSDTLGDVLRVMRQHVPDILSTRRGPLTARNAGWNKLVPWSYYE